MMNKESLLAQLNRRCKNTLMETLNITYTDIGDNYLVATMPVTSRVHQPMGLLHGGAMMALAESVGSAASVVFTNPKTQEVRGIQMSANHLKSVKEGLVSAKATITHLGKSTHLWEIRIVDQLNQLVSICQLTNMILYKDK